MMAPGCGGPRSAAAWASISAASSRTGLPQLLSQVPLRGLGLRDPPEPGPPRMRPGGWPGTSSQRLPGRGAMATTIRWGLAALRAGGLCGPVKLGVVLPCHKWPRWRPPRPSVRRPGPRPLPGGLPRWRTRRLSTATASGEAASWASRAANSSRLCSWASLNLGLDLSHCLRARLVGCRS